MVNLKAVKLNHGPATHEKVAEAHEVAFELYEREQWDGEGSIVIHPGAYARMMAWQELKSGRDYRLESS